MAKGIIILDMPKDCYGCSIVTDYAESARMDARYSQCRKGNA